MGSLNILPTNGVNLLSFVSQKLPPKLHKITALVIAILAVDVAVRYAFYSRTINASEFEPFSNKCASLEEVINLLKDANSFLMRGSLEALNPTIKKIHETSQELSNNKSLNPFEITIEKSPLPGLTTRLLQKVTSIFSLLNPSLNYNLVYDDETNPGDEGTYRILEISKVIISRFSDEKMNTMNDLKKDLESKAELIIYFLKKYPIFKTIKTNISFGHSSTLIADLAVLSHHLKLKYPKWNIVASWDGLSVSAIESE